MPVAVRLGVSLAEAVFIRRINRFAALVELGGVPAVVHVPNSGRLGELLVAGARAWVAPPARAATGARRRTAGDLVAVRRSGPWVAVDARLPPALLSAAVGAGALAPFAGYEGIRREVRLGGSRADLLLERGGAPPCWIEAKSVTLVEAGEARFPDAPTARGARHMDELAGAVRRGERAAAVFVIQREDARRFRPNDETDPAFGEALRRAAAAGVEVYAYRCAVRETGWLELAGPVPVLL